MVCETVVTENSFFARARPSSARRYGKRCEINRELDFVWMLPGSWKIISFCGFALFYFGLHKRVVAILAFRLQLWTKIHTIRHYWVYKCCKLFSYLRSSTHMFLNGRHTLWKRKSHLIPMFLVPFSLFRLFLYLLVPQLCVIKIVATFTSATELTVITIRVDAY